MELLKKNEKMYVVLDLETTGLHPSRHGITEIAALKFNGMQILEEFHTLVNPERHIPSGIERLTGITNEMVADAPTIDEVMSDVRNFLAESVIVGHNVSFDFRFLNWYHYKCFEEYLVNETICTMKLSRQYLPHLPNKKLSTVGEYFGIVNEQAHRAMSDTLATLQIFQKYLEWEKHSRSEDG